MPIAEGEYQELQAALAAEEALEIQKAQAQKMREINEAEEASRIEAQIEADKLHAMHILKVRVAEFLKIRDERDKAIAEFLPLAASLMRMIATVELGYRELHQISEQTAYYQLDVGSMGQADIAFKVPALAESLLKDLLPADDYGWAVGQILGLRTKKPEY